MLLLTALHKAEIAAGSVSEPKIQTLAW